ncbi:outer membrane beta-barrel protein [Herbaspirillum sp. RTI4]|uniref:outer membrane beta-barrel protein n=1 Tax=Herbaspirillum sp. RTI4 TaxID=3048640 RepID=UPI002AB3F2CB|nr:outer membrane beta-barrel protein [Herbaspirillum sp. RTI4]MDY7578192.1 outer membrane beta-barrel protein [Herbaspirillum sp. RTI4]MEA9981530.1 outer membrane beta-barrel protein [Herbaspirillum sp. RTI4]
MSKRILRTSLTLAAMTAALVSIPSFAADESGFYMGGGLGYQNTDIDDIGDYADRRRKNGYDVSEKDSGLGMKIYGGYQFNQNFAIEGSWIDMGKYTAEERRAGYHEDFKVKTYGLGIAAVGLLPVTSEISLMGKVGGIYKNTKITDSTRNTGPGYSYSREYESKKHSVSLLLGVGAEYKITPKLALRVEYEYFGKTPVSSDSDAKMQNHLLSAGVRYTF